MKARTKRIFGCFMAFITALPAQPLPSLAAETKPQLQTKLDVPDLWLAISQLENRTDPWNYAALIPQIEQLVLSYENYQTDSLYFRDDCLYWRADGVLNRYDPALRARQEQLPENEPSPEEPEIPEELQTEITVSRSYLDPSVNLAAHGERDVYVCSPYHGTERSPCSVAETQGMIAAIYTGGEFYYDQGTDATIQKLADAIESCAVVLINTHGNKNTICITSREGITDEDFDKGNAHCDGKFYKTVDGEEVFDYELFTINGQAIVDHMDQDAPNNLVILSSCESMKDDGLFKPLREHGVAVVYGYSESISSEGGTMMENCFLRALEERRTVAEAMAQMKAEIGCDWDAIWRHYTLKEAQDYGVAFPIVVSDEDSYPGAGNVNAPQEVCSSWRLPVNDKVPLKLTLSWNCNYTDFLLINQDEYDETIYKVSVESGSLPPGTSLTFQYHNLCLAGRPERAGYNDFVLRLETLEGTVFTREFQIVTADYNKIHTSSQNITVTAASVPKWNSGFYFSDISRRISIEFPFELSALPFAENQLGYLPLSLEFGYSYASKKGYLRSRKSSVSSTTTYMSVPVGSYYIPVEFVMKTGEIYRHTVYLTVEPAHIYKMYSPVQVTLDKDNKCTFDANYDDETNKYVKWSAGSITSVSLQGGTLPDGMFLANSWLRPCGLHGTPTELKDTEFQCRIATYCDYYDYTVPVHTRKLFTGNVSIRNDEGGIGSILEAEMTDLTDSNYDIIWEYYDEKEDKLGWKPIPEAANAPTYTVTERYADTLIRVKLKADYYDYEGEIKSKYIHV
ncbi:MAG: hypothetical protein J6S92_14260, partial [Oscillospiraceae bacterium]|nr:hypothetical protein [Oscillospiraceae bacterium]